METTAIILAGGKSSRMGSDKGVVKLNGKFLIEYSIEAVKNIVQEIIIIANNNNYNQFGHKVFSDIYKDCGPMGGIQTGLKHSKNEKNIILSCDIPFISESLINYLIKNSDNNEITLPMHDNKIEPLCGVYSKKCNHTFELLMKQKKYKMKDSLSYFTLKKIDVSSQNFYSPFLFHNMNSKTDLDSIVDKIPQLNKFNSNTNG